MKQKEKPLYINRVYNYLTIIKFLNGENTNHLMVECKCACGNITVVRFNKVVTGHTKSCGCLRTALLLKRLTTHGFCKHPLYRVWANMIQRTEDKNNNRYYIYGARGITICKEWRKDFKVFFDWAISNNWERGLQIDRIDNDGNYEPNNCRIVTVKENMNNTSRNRIFTINGEKINLTQLANKHNMTPSRLWARLTDGWDINDALNRPLKKVTKWWD